MLVLSGAAVSADGLTGLGARGELVIVTAMFFASAVVFSRIGDLRSQPDANASCRGGDLLRNFVGGLSYLFRHRELARVFAIRLTIYVGVGGQVLLTIYSEEFFKLGESGTGLLYMARGLGMLVGGLGLVQLVLAKGLRGTDAIGVGLALFGLGYLMSTAVSGFGIGAVALMLGLGFVGEGLLKPMTMALIQQHCDPQYLARVIAAEQGLSSAVQSAAALVIAACVVTDNPATVLWASAVTGALLLVACVVWFAMTRVSTSRRRRVAATDRSLRLLMLRSPDVHSPSILRVAAVVEVCQHFAVGTRHVAVFVSAVTAASWVPLSAQVSSASAQPCPDVQVVFAAGHYRGCQASAQQVRRLWTRCAHESVQSRSAVYPVDYPATTNFHTALDGINDASAHVLSVASACPNTKLVLGGFSQGAAVMGFVTANVIPDGAPEGVPNPMPPNVADHVAAVALFGKPNNRFMRAINEPQIAIGPMYADKTIDLCVHDDFVCSSGTDFNAHTRYTETGLVDQAATFTAGRLLASSLGSAAIHRSCRSADHRSGRTGCSGRSAPLHRPHRLHRRNRRLLPPAATTPTACAGHIVVVPTRMSGHRNVLTSVSSSGCFGTDVLISPTNDDRRRKIDLARS